MPGVGALEKVCEPGLCFRNSLFTSFDVAELRVCFDIPPAVFPKTLEIKSAGERSVHPIDAVFAVDGR